MVEITKVKLYGDDLGVIRWNDRYKVALFEYAESFLKKRIEPAPIMMPVKGGRIYSFGEIGKETFKGLPGMLADHRTNKYSCIRLGVHSSRVRCATHND